MGLDADEARTVLADGTFGEQVRAEQAEARALGITGVPFFVIDRTYGVSGAQPADVLLRALQQAWGDRPALEMVASGAAAACEGDSCAL